MVTIWPEAIFCVEPHSSWFNWTSAEFSALSLAKGLIKILGVATGSGSFPPPPLLWPSFPPPSPLLLAAIAIPPITAAPAIAPSTPRVEIPAMPALPVSAPIEVSAMVGTTASAAIGPASVANGKAARCTPYSSSKISSLCKPLASSVKKLW